MLACRLFRHNSCTKTHAINAVQDGSATSQTGRPASDQTPHARTSHMQSQGHRKKLHEATNSKSNWDSSAAIDKVFWRKVTVIAVAVLRGVPLQKGTMLHAPGVKQFSVEHFFQHYVEVKGLFLPTTRCIHNRCRRYSQNLRCSSATCWEAAIHSFWHGSN